MTKPGRLPSTEFALMQQLWRGQALTAKELLEALYPHSESSQHGTIQRLLQRLEEKGVVRRTKERGVQVFSATLTQEEYTVGIMESLADELTEGALAPLVTHLINARLSAAEIAGLKRFLEDK